MVESAARSIADAVFLDLEDAVPEAEKSLALSVACDALTRLDWGSKTVAVRINSMAHPAVRAEVSALAKVARLDSIIVPRAEKTCDVDTIAQWIDAEPERPSRSPLELELLIETAAGLAFVERLAECNEKVSALHLGVGDLAASLGARSLEIGASPLDYRELRRGPNGTYVDTPLDFFAVPMMCLLVAARAFGLRAIDGPCGNFKDVTLSAAQARRAASMGYDGKQVIHPDQIVVTIEAFTPSESEVVQALRVKEALTRAAAAGVGAVTVDGRMIDGANIRMVDRLLRLAGRL
jgi:malyl-CoA/(S)-citramalyl-CoA lyase